MTDHPILFRPEMVRAILDGRKTVTRRVLKPQPATLHDKIDAAVKWRVGDRLWVRETLRPWSQDAEVLAYAADDKRIGEVNGETDWPVFLGKRRHVVSIHMPRWVSRIALLVEGVRVERLQDISEDDARAEGANPYMAGHGIATRDEAHRLRADGFPYSKDYRAGFQALWGSINGPDSWDANPWVAAIKFQPIFANIDTEGDR